MVGLTHKASKCIHHWMIGNFIHSDGHGDHNYEPAECKKCGAVKRFRSRRFDNPAGTAHWGREYNGWDDKRYESFIHATRQRRLGEESRKRKARGVPASRG